MPNGTGVAVAVGLLCLFLATAGCAPLVPRPVSVTPADAARIHAACPQGSFIGAMTLDCPQIAE